MYIDLYLDSSPVSDLPENIADEIIRRNLVASRDKAKVSFCGMLNMHGAISIFLPRSIDHKGILGEEKITVASSLLKAVEIYGRQSKTAVHISDEGEGRSGITRLSLIRQLLLGYRQNGLYARRRVVSQINAGKPDWRATVTAGGAFPARDGRPIYLNIKGSKRRYFSDCEVARIHAYVLRTLDDTYSWIFTGKEGLMAPELKDVPSPVGANLVMRAVLKSELRLVYSDNEIALIKALIEYLELEAGDEEGSTVSGLKSFHYAWEHMLYQVLANKYPINNVLPAPSYKKTLGGYEDAFASAMKTDISLKHPENDTVAIVDAKYYAARNVSTAPGWPDLMKQFFYEKAFSLIEPDYEVRNAFIFPGEEGPLESAHLKSREDGGLFDDDFSPIACYYVKPLDVIEHFVQNRKMQDLTNILLGC